MENKVCVIPPETYAPKKAPVRKGVPLTPLQIERLQGVVGVSYGKLMQMQHFGTLYQFCKERGIKEL